MSRFADAQEARDFLAANPDIRRVHLLFTDMTGVFRGKAIQAHELEAAYRTGRPLPTSTLAMTVRGVDVEDAGLLWEIGDRDCTLRPVAGTLVRCPWMATPTAQVLMAVDPDSLPAYHADPRGLLARVVDGMAADGLHPVMAVELEFYLFDADRAPGAPLEPARGQLSGVRPTHSEICHTTAIEDMAPFLDEVYDAAEAQGIAAETAISEFAAGQYEVTLHHRTDPMRAVDEGVMLKRLVKAVAQRHGMVATFMAKPLTHEAGSGMHLHVSLCDAAGRNVFAGAEPEGNPPLRHAVAGLLDTMADATLVFAPGANSYRRFQPGSYAPVTRTWGLDNRTVAVRVTAGDPETRHIEHRVAGADANPYLAAAAVLAGLRHGLKEGLAPPPAVDGNGYDQPGAPLPTSWADAVALFEQSAVLRRAFGDDFVRMFACVKAQECNTFNTEVSDRDLTWYLRDA
ncbi:glutamine synthetase family protein [Caenispirillum salinarum AK4]|uniref:Glutamine synthetase family protein n=1 Tax=Caenispirillum salinarum AK4 TaxID=1238182 RepID=K9HN93_9PROT|nr:glutamine synthetase family protein [Caenispirillum salinarum]EKV30006.1 glutamine synthetase family protein [Caenispirillum salinarum AK4]